MASRRPPALLVVGALLLGACSGDGDGGTSEAIREAVEAGPSSTTSTEPAPTTTNPVLAGLGGLIATADRAGLQLIDPTTGAIEAEFIEDGFVTQPTWSRDGTQLIAMAFEPASGASRLLLVDAVSRTSREVASVRQYFFFSWSPDGSLIAALGPGEVGPDGRPATTLDVLDPDGRVVSTGQLAGGSLYVAWEPEGRSILAHQDNVVLLLDDPTDLDATKQVAVAASTSFQAAAWVPGTRQMLIVSERPGNTALSLIDVDSGDTISLGAATEFALITVAPDGLTAAIGHAPAATAEPVAFAPGQEPGPRAATALSAVVEVIDLATGNRTAVSEVPALWLEWSPDGEALIALHSDLTWSIWTDDGSRTLAETRPSNIFFDRYIVFSGAYIEAPRLWSPDGGAITYSGVTDDGNRLFVLPIEAGATPMAVDLGSAHVAFWSPG